MHSEFQNIIDKWTANQTIEVKIITLFEKVRDIPYGNIGSRKPLDVYSQNKGTCSGKHELLKALYKTLGIQVKDFIIMHNFNELHIKYPTNIQQILEKTNIIDPHNFIKIKINNKWCTVDVTWDKALKKHGFLVNENWNGKSNMKISVTKGGKIHETEKSIILKEKLLKNMPEELQKEREIFLEKLTIWLDILRRKDTI